MMKKNFLVISTILLFCITGIQAQTIVWKQLASLPEGYGSGEAISLNSKIYFVAGRAAKRTEYFYEFNPKLNAWKKLANIPRPATNLAMTAVNGKIYAIGGDNFQNTNREYDPQTNTWKILEPMPTARQHIDCGTYGNNIFIIGGLTSWKNISQKTEVFNVTRNTWTEKVSIPSLRNNAAIVSKDSIIYVIGGAGSKDDIWAGIKSVECYNIKSDSWVQKKDLPFRLFKPGAIVVDNEIIVLGGLSEVNGKSTCLEKVLMYKTETDNWVETTPLPAKNVFFACTSIGNKIYVIGGSTGGIPNWNYYSTVYEGELITNNSKD